MKNISYYTSEHILENFYEAIADGDDITLSRVHIPISDVFYVRQAIKDRTGEEYTLDHVERAMYLEGWLSADDVFEPETKRDGID